MAEKKAHEVDAWLARPDPSIRLVLLYGPDRGLVSERASTLVAARKFDPDDPFSVLRADAGLMAEPGRLLDELRSIPMFGGTRLVWLRNGSPGRELIDAIGLVAADPPADSLLLVEAGDLRKGSALRTLFERSERAMALPCYGDDGRSVDRILDAALSTAGMTMTLEAREQFGSMLGGDRLASRSEIDKLLLYCHGMHTIGIDEVLACAGDVSALGADAVVDAVLAGQTARFDAAFMRALAGGMRPDLVLSSMLRQMQQLQQLRHQMDANGGKPTTIVAAARPPVFYARRSLIAEALSTWAAPAIASALGRLQNAVYEVRGNAAIAPSACHRTLLALCLEAARRSRRSAA